MKSTLFSIIVSVILVVAAIVFTQVDITDNPENFSDTATIIDGKQIVGIYAKGGYFPKIIKAKANIPTIIKVETRGTFDCSSALAIPTIGYREFLPPSGITEINVLPQKAGTIMNGLCSMGMYSFNVEFE